MKIENSWVNLTLVKIEAGNDRVMALKEYNTGKVFRIDNDVDELDQIVITGDGEYYICFEINKEVDYTDERQPEYGIVAKMIDHINEVKYDNRISNIRETNRNQNGLNISSSKGYYFSKSGRYYAQITYEVKYISLNDYYIYQFHSILDNEYLSWQEKPEMIRDLSNDISTIFSKCK